MNSLTKTFILGMATMTILSCGKKESYKSVDSFDANVTVLKTSLVSEKETYLNSLAEFKKSHQDTLMQAQGVKTEIEALGAASETEAKKSELEKTQSELTEKISAIDRDTQAFIKENVDEVFNARFMISQGTVDETFYRVEVKLENKENVILARDVKYNLSINELSFSYNIKAKDHGFLHYEFLTSNGKEGDLTIHQSASEFKNESAQVKHLGIVTLKKVETVKETEKAASEVETKEEPESESKSQAESESDDKVETPAEVKIETETEATAEAGK